MVLAIGVLWGLTSLPAPTEATLITIEIEAVVDSVMDEGNYLEGKIKAGDIITGFYTYDSSATRLPGHRYEFYSAPSGVVLSVGGFDFKADPSSVYFEMGIGDDLSWGDTYFFISFNNLPLANDTLVDEILWSLKDPTGTALSSDALPITTPVLEDWQENILSIGADRRYGIFAHVTSAVPEPATIILFGLGAILLKKRK